MAYVGNPIDTQNTFQSLVGKRFDGDGSTTDFTLDVVPGNVLDIYPPIIMSSEGNRKCRWISNVCFHSR